MLNAKIFKCGVCHLIAWIYIAPFMRPKVALQRRTGQTKHNKTKGSQTTSQTDKTTNRLGAKGLSKQMGLEGPFEGVKRGDVADLGAATLKVRGVVSRPESEDRRFRGGACGRRRSDRYWGA